MTTLKDLQQHLMDAIHQKAQLPSFIASNPRLPAASSLSIYQQSVVGNHLSALQEIFPVSLRLVGQSFFSHMAKAFLRWAEHKYFDISAFGEDFPEFIRTFEPAKALAYLADTAQLEWVCHLAVLGERYEGFDVQALADISEEDQEGLCFVLPPNSCLLKSPYPILRIWQFNQNPDANENISLKEGADCLFIWRQGLDLTIERLNEMEWFCLNHFMHRRPIGKMFYALNKQFCLTDEACQKIFVHMLQRGWLVGFNVI